VSDLVVLCYHGVSARWPAETTVAPADFQAQLEDLVGRGYRGLTLSDALTAPPPGRNFVVTFDDAHASVGRLARPIMDRLGIPGTVYVPTDFPDSGRLMAWDGYDVWDGTEHAEELACMGWDELRDMAAAGWEVGSHTCSHPRLSTLAPDQIERELVESRAVCEREIGVPCRSIAYPYSDYDDRTIRAARDAGYESATTVPRGPTAPLPLEWPRVGVYWGEDARRLRARIAMRRLGPSPVARGVRLLRGLR
jgi:peptidoglycan/xylan/chitin deacetylase (PgdA/CDA1 family)